MNLQEKEDSNKIKWSERKKRFGSRGVIEKYSNYQIRKVFQLEKFRAVWDKEPHS